MLVFASKCALRIVFISLSISVVTAEDEKLRGGNVHKAKNIANKPIDTVLPIPSLLQEGTEIFFDDNEIEDRVRSRSRHGGYDTTEDYMYAKKRVINGVEAKPDQFPFTLMVGRHEDGSLFSRGCGATLIEDEWILTAAHCNCEGGDIAWIGAYNAGSTRERADVQECFRHPNFEWPKYDLALCRLNTTSLMPKVRIAESSHHIDENRDLTVIGIGATVYGEGSTRTLSYAPVPYQSKQFCDNLYTSFMPDNMLCAGGGTTDACQGDSGGPLYDEVSGELVQVGIVSWGSGCAKEGHPGVYADIRTQRDWIDGVICSNSVNSVASMCTESRNEQTSTTTTTATEVPEQAENTCVDSPGKHKRGKKIKYCHELKPRQCKKNFWKSTCPKSCNACLD